MELEEAEINRNQDFAKICVVDDSEFSRKFIISILEKHEYSIVGEAESAGKTIEVLQQQEPNIFIIDVVMPKVSGIGLAKQIHETFNKSSIIMISSLAQEHIIIEAISAGAQDYLQKPFTEDQLMRSIEKVCQQMVEDKKV
jgi:two-component system chemotaxis response regulator CheY